MSDKNKLDLFSIVLLGINAIIGSGIFVLPGDGYSKLGPASVLVIIFCMVLSVSIALCFAEAGSWFEENGGPYVYAREAFGDFIGFEVGFMKWAIGIIAWAAMANIFTTVLANVWPTAADPTVKKIIISVVVIGLGIINIMGVKISKIINNVVTIGKLIPIIAFIAVGMFFIKGGNFTPFVILPENTTFMSAFFTAAISLFYAYTGFESLAIAAEDMENPKKNVPKAMVLVMAFVSIVYFLIIAISIGILGKDLAGSSIPVSDAATAIVGPIGGWFVTIGTIVSIGGINIAASFGTPRSGVALAENGLLPKSVAKTNKKGVPYIAIIITCVLTLMIALSGTYSQLIKISVISRFIQYIPTCIAVLVFRKKYVGKEVNFKIPFGPVVPIFATIVSIVLLAFAGSSEPEKILWGFGGLLIGVPMYFIMRYLNKDK
ncbi:APC family permease [Clostridium cadaveris]|uniref:APC family permease n=1 Tax=Clostridium cadaveris TaxID=1529 RepID=UPI000C07E444|nr:APC family permease [Clostridium cadaveris]